MLTLQEFIELNTKKPKGNKPERAVVTKGYYPKAPDEQAFVEKHPISKIPSRIGNDDKLYNASNIKPINRSANRQGYEPSPHDAEAYSE